MKDIIVIKDVHFFTSLDEISCGAFERYVIFNNIDELKKLMEILPSDLISSSCDRFELRDFAKTVDTKSVTATSGYLVLKSLGDLERFKNRSILGYLFNKKVDAYNAYKNSVADFKNEAKVLKSLIDAFPPSFPKKQRIMYLSKIYESRQRLNEYASKIKKTRFEKNKAMSEYDKHFNFMYRKDGK